MSKKEKLKAYISGKITGLKEEVYYKNFERLEIKYNKLNFNAYNPVKMVPFKEGKTWIEYLIDDIKLLLECDVIVMMSNWKDSKGARIEHNIAFELGLSIIYEQ